MLKNFIAFILKYIDPKKPMGVKLFNAIAQLVVTPTVEVVAFREQNGQVQVFLTQRSLSEKSYPGFWHLPGTVIRPGETLKASLERMANAECKVGILNYKVVGLINNLKEPRGHFIAPIILVNFVTEPITGKWVSVSSLDASVIDFHKNLIIPLALECYQKQNFVKVVENVTK